MSTPERKGGNDPSPADPNRNRPAAGLNQPDFRIDGPEPNADVIPEGGAVRIPVEHEEVVKKRKGKQPARQPKDTADPDKAAKNTVAPGGQPEEQPKPAEDTTRGKKRKKK